MTRSIVLDRVAVVAEMCRQDLAIDELSRRAGVGRCAIWKVRQSKPVWRTTAGHVANALGVPLEQLKQQPQEQEVHHVERQQ